MRNASIELDILRTKINLERAKYKNAIINQQLMQDVKLIYLRIKELEKQATLLMQYANRFI